VPSVGQPVPHAGHVPQSLDRQPVALPDGSGVDPDQHRIGGDDRRVDVFESEGIRWARGEQGRGLRARQCDQPPLLHRPGRRIFLVDDIQTATAELRSAGVEILFESGLDDSGNAWVHFRAPDGNIYEFTQDPGISDHTSVAPEGRRLGTPDPPW
jgi:catechol 2,3-dioxygenase-like lactoylglutathione lyase family enzyme